METYDLYLGRIADWVVELRRGGKPVREFQVCGDPQTLVAELPLRVGPGAQTGVLLRRDTHAELGNPSLGSSAFVMWTRDPGLVRDGRITLIGPDFDAAASQALPFGQVLIVGGRELGTQDQPLLEQRQSLSNQLEGYMVKSAPGRLWSRVSREAAARGFDCVMLGKALIASLKRELAKIEAMELLFVTSGREEIAQLEAFADQVRVLGKAFRREAWREKGFDLVECTLGTDCRSCGEKSTCDDIRDVVKIRKQRERAPEPSSALLDGS